MVLVGDKMTAKELEKAQRRYKKYQHRRRQRFLFRCMCLLMAVGMFIGSIFGTFI